MNNLDEARELVNRALTEPHGPDVDALADALILVIGHLRASAPSAANRPEKLEGSNEPDRDATDTATPTGSFRPVRTTTDGSGRESYVSFAVPSAANRPGKGEGSGSESSIRELERRAEVAESRLAERDARINALLPVARAAVRQRNANDAEDAMRVISQAIDALPADVREELGRDG